MRTGKDFHLKSLDDGRAVYLNASRVGNVAAHPAFLEAAHSIARLYDVAADPANRELLTYPSPKPASRSTAPT